MTYYALSQIIWALVGLLIGLPLGYALGKNGRGAR